MAGGVINDDEALRLIGELGEKRVVDIADVRDRAIPLARLAAANLCEIGAHSVWITVPGMIATNILIGMGYPARGVITGQQLEAGQKRREGRPE